MQIQTPTSSQLTSLNLRLGDLHDKLFMVFFGQHDYNVVSKTKVMPFEEGLRRVKGDSLWQAAVHEAVQYVKDRAAGLPSANAHIWS